MGKIWQRPYFGKENAALTARYGLGDEPAVAEAIAMRSGWEGGQEKERIFLSRRRLRAKSDALAPPVPNEVRELKRGSGGGVTRGETPQRSEEARLPNKKPPPRKTRRR